MPCKHPVTMMNEKNREIGRRFREALWDEDHTESAASLIAPECRIHGLVPFSTDFTSGPEAIRQLIAFYQLTFSEIAMTVDRTVVEGKNVAVHWNGRGRHTGDLLGLPPTGREVRVNGIDLLEISDGLIVEAWLTWNDIGMLEQLLAAKDGTDPDTADLLTVVEKILQ